MAILLPGILIAIFHKNVRHPEGGLTSRVGGGVSNIQGVGSFPSYIFPTSNGEGLTSRGGEV